MEAFSALLAICAENSPVPGEFPAQRPVTRSFDVLFDLRPNKRLGKQSWGWWSETPSSSLWRHRNANTGGLIRCPIHRGIALSSPAITQSNTTLRWRHNGRNGVAKQQPHDCIINRLFRRRSKKTSKVRVTGLCVGNSPGTVGMAPWWHGHAFYTPIHLNTVAMNAPASITLEHS